VGALRESQPAPTAASLGEFGETPVNLYTGQPSVTIPLHTVEGVKLSVPVRLRYRGGGIEVSNVPPWVGTGWTLEAGGAVTRTVRGLPDGKGGADGRGSGYLSTGRLICGAVWGRADGRSENGYSSDCLSVAEYRDGVERTDYDPEPDQYFFNVAGKSGKFVLGPQGEAYVVPHRNWEIDYDVRGSQGIVRWTVTTEDGTRYVFGGTRSGARDFSYEEPDMYRGRWTSTWHLVRIESPHGTEEVRFEYSGLNELSYAKPPYAEAQVFVGNTQNRPTQTKPRSERVKTRYLERIETPREVVAFESSEREEGRPGFRTGDPRKLDRVVVKAKKSGETKKRYVFDYSTDEHAGRLFLDRLEENGSDGSDKPPYRFRYYDEETLPGRLSTSVDHWGYYNGRSNGDERIPNAKYAYDGQTAFYYGADRRPQAPHMKAGVLTRVRYPTGGYTELVWEPHEYSYVGTGEMPSSRRTESKLEVAAVVRKGTETREVRVVNEFDGTPVSVKFSAFANVPGGNNSCSGGQCVEASLLDSKGNNQFEYVPSAEGVNNQFQTTKPLDSGETYTLKVVARDTSVDGGIEVQVSWKNQYEKEVTKEMAGGLRIRAIRKYDGLGGEPEVTAYRYPAEAATSIENPSVSAGVLVSQPHYFWVQDFRLDGELKRAVNLSTNPIGGLGLTQGSTIGYERVIVVPGGDLGEGWTEHRFFTAKDEGHGDGSPVPIEKYSPVARRTSYDYKRGQKTGTKVYDGDGTLREKTEITWYYSDNRQTGSREGVRPDPPGPPQPPTRRVRGLAFKTETGTPTYSVPFAVVSAWVHRIEKTTWTYGEEGKNAVSKTTDYLFETDPDAAAFTQSRGTRVTTSNGRERTRRHEYAHEKYDMMGRDVDQGESHQLSQKYRTTVFEDANENGRVDVGEAVWKRKWTKWMENENAYGHWVPATKWVWTGQSK
jgi:hypothetical protein